jgi:hypothetical protein
LKLKLHVLLSNFAFIFDLRRYIGGMTALQRLVLKGNQLTTVPATLGGLKVAPCRSNR